MTSEPIPPTSGKLALPVIAVGVIALLVITIALDIGDSTFEKAMFVAGLGMVLWAGVLAPRYRRDEAHWPRLRWLLLIQVAFGLSWASDLFTSPGTRAFFAVQLTFLLVVGTLLFLAFREPRAD